MPDALKLNALKLNALKLNALACGLIFTASWGALRAAAASPRLMASSVGAGRSFQSGLAGYDFGQVSGIRKPALVTHVFFLRNDGRSTVTVDHVQTSCSCTTASLEGPTGLAASSTIAAGQQVRVRVTVDPTHLSTGPLHKSVWVYLTGQAAPAATLEMTGTLQPDVLFAPAVLDFDRDPAGRSRVLLLRVTLSAALRASGAKPRLVCSLPSIRITPEGAAAPASAAPAPPTGPSSVTQTYRVTLSPQAPPGELDALVSLVLPASGAAPETVAASVPVTGEVTQAAK